MFLFELRYFIFSELDLHLIPRHLLIHIIISLLIFFEKLLILSNLFLVIRLLSRIGFHIGAQQLLKMNYSFVLLL